MSPASKRDAAIRRTEVRGSKDREISLLAACLRSLGDVRSADDHSVQLGSRGCDELTMREREILAMISQGLSNKNIARALEISPETVKSHVKHIFSKLRVSTRTEAVFRSVSLDLL